MYHRAHFAKGPVDSAGRFRRPMEIEDATDIPLGDKIALLEAWEADERALLRAEDEGMGGGEHSHLQRVQEALARLQQFCARS